LGAFAAANNPGTRLNAASWTDSNGNLWLFGGDSFSTGNAAAQLNDLWEYAPATGQWAWIGGSNFAGQSGIYGSLGVTASSSTPGGRYSASSWNGNGTLWLYGGSTPAGGNNSISLGDLWQSGIPAATPVLSPAAGNYSTTQTVGITDGTASSSILYTTDGTTPTRASTQYSGSLMVDTTKTVNPTAVAAGYINSAMASATYTLPAPTVATPSFSLGTNRYTSVQTVSISDTTPSVSLFYTTNS
jgi:hypothetical protein